jgi:hypothetical protein
VTPTYSAQAKVSDEHVDPSLQQAEMEEFEEGDVIAGETKQGEGEFLVLFR